MRKLLSVLFSTLQGRVRGGLLFYLFFASAINIYASDTQVGGIWYDFNSSTKTASVTYRGYDYDSYDGEYFGSVVIPETVTYNGTTYGVTSIRSRAFEDCSSLTSITIPNGVTSIGGQAFYGCTSLTSVTIPNSVTSIGNYAFRYCSSLPVENNLRYADTYLVEAVNKTLSTYSIKEGTKWVGDGAFYDCTSLTSVTIPNSVTSIGEWAFSGCSSLTSVTIGESVTSIGAGAFYNCSSLTSVTIPNSVTSIGDDAFCNCYSLTSVTIPNSVTSIGSDAFQYCFSLTSVTIDSESIISTNKNRDTSMGDIFGEQVTEYTIGNSVTSIGDNAFQYCSSLTSITIGHSVTSIGGGAFFGCSSLTSVTIPNSVTSIGGHAFYGCHNVETITILAKSVQELCINNLNGKLYNASLSEGNRHIIIDDKEITSLIIPEQVDSISEKAFFSCTSLTSVTIPNSVTSIGDWAFDGCSSLTSVTIPNSVTSIGAGAFDGCSSLTIVTIGNGITSIEDYTFRYCSSLTSVTFGNSVTSIGFYSFLGCAFLTSVTIHNSVTSIDSDAFDGCDNVERITILANSVQELCTSNLNEKLYYADLEEGNRHIIIDDKEITSLIIPEQVNSISEKAFYRCSSLTSITIPNSVTSIEYDAFYNCENLNSIILGSGLKEIKERAFGGSRQLYDIYCYAPEPPTAYNSSFANYNVNLYIPCDNLKAYQMDAVFGSFKYIQCIDSEDVSTNGVVITPSTNDVTITWPTEGNADTYTIVIKKGNEVFCTLTFNADGQLLNIAFAPGRDGNHPAQYAEQAVNGYRFTVTGLEEGTHYAYNIDVKDAADKTIKSYTGEFTTESLTAVENITTNNANIQKILRDGQLLILRDGVEYTIMGQKL